MTTAEADPVPVTPSPQPAPDNLTTLESHILAEERRFRGTGVFTWVLSALTFSAKIIESKIRRARLEDVLGAMGSENVTGDTQQKLDVIANETLLRALGPRPGVAVIASEEECFDDGHPRNRSKR